MSREHRSRKTRRSSPPPHPQPTKLTESGSPRSAEPEPGEAPLDGQGQQSSDETLPDLSQWHNDVRRRWLLNITLDQLRTLVMLHRTGSPYAAARSMAPRQQSSVLAQLNTLNKYFLELCGDQIARKQGRGKPYVFTHTGERAVSWATFILNYLDHEIARQAQHFGHELAIGATAFTAPLVGHVLEELRTVSDVRIRLVQLRSKDRWRVLDDDEVKLVLGAVIAVDGSLSVPNGVSMLPAGPRDPAALLTNLPRDVIPDVIDEERLKKHEVLLPQSGIVTDLVREVYGPDYTRVIRRVDPWISDIYYGLNILKYGILKASMVVLKSVGEWIERGGPSPAFPNAPPQTNLRVVRLVGRFERVRVQPGLFGRSEDLQQYDLTHPVRLFWSIFEKRISKAQSLIDTESKERSDARRVHKP